MPYGFLKCRAAPVELDRERFQFADKEGGKLALRLGDDGVMTGVVSLFWSTTRKTNST